MVTVIAGIVSPQSVALVGFLMFGNLLRECGVLRSLSETAQNVLANLISLLLGLTVAVRMQAESFLVPETLMILGLGLIAFMFDTFGGVLFGKLINLFAKKKINPMIGAAGVSAFPDVLPRDCEDGEGRRPLQLHPHAGRRPRTRRPGGLRHRGRYHSGARRAAGVKGGTDYEAQYTGFSNSLVFMGEGMLGIFAVMVIIIGVIYALGHFTAKKEE